jgi:hypothetical protein
MFAFIYLAYRMMPLLYETVPAFEETWIECLGDRGRYRMAIEDDDIRHRYHHRNTSIEDLGILDDIESLPRTTKSGPEMRTRVSRQWYLKASELAHGHGRLYHHLAILRLAGVYQKGNFPITVVSGRQNLYRLCSVRLFPSKQTHRLLHCSVVQQGYMRCLWDICSRRLCLIVKHLD